MTGIMAPPPMGGEHAGGRSNAMSLLGAPAKTLDCRRRGPAARVSALLSHFDSLAPGESVVVESEEEPRPLLAALQSQRKGLFEWSPLEEGRGRWRVEVFRRGAALGGLREVREALACDHDRLEAIEAEAFKARAAGDLTAARVRFTLFARGLRRHIRFEDDLLFPVFEARSGFGSGAGPTVVMRMEHREIEALLDRIGGAIGEPGAAADTLRGDLHRILADHNLREEQVLYPGTDRLLSPAQRDELVGSIQAS